MRLSPAACTLPILAAAAAASSLPGSAARAALPTSGSQPSTAAPRLPRYFEANAGQADRSVRYLTRGSGYTLFLTDNEAIVSLARGGDAPASATLRIRPLGATARPPVSGEAPLSGRVSYLVGPESAWRRNVPLYQQVRYTGVYPGIDLVYYGTGRRLEYDFLVGAGVDPGRVRLSIQGAERASVDAGGALLLHTAAGPVRQEPPVAYQQVNGVRRTVPCSYDLRKRGAGIEVAFRLGDYDRARPLVIDPVLDYSTFLGGAGEDAANGVAVDYLGNVYLAGTTNSNNFPTSGAFQPQGRARDAFVTKLDASGQLVFSTYLGGQGAETARAVAVDGSGNVYLAGNTASTDFPTAGSPFQARTGGASDAFVTKVDASGTALVYSTYLGGSGRDAARGIAVAQDGSAVVAGETVSTNFPTLNPVQGVNRGGQEAFVTRISPAGVPLYSTYLGGGGTDGANAVAFHADGGAVVAGEAAAGFPTTAGAFRTGANGGFVTRLTPSGSAAVYSSGFPCSLQGVWVDGTGSASVVGTTRRAQMPTRNAFQATLRGGSDAFVARLDAAGASLLYGSFLGGAGDDSGAAIALDPEGRAHVTGTTASSNFPTREPFQPAFAGVTDAFVAKLNLFAAGSDSLVYSSFLGGSAADEGLALGATPDGGAWVAGSTGSASFPVAAAFQPAGGGGTDAFVSRVSPLTFAAPSELAATTLSRTEVRLTWRDNTEGEEAFQIERKTTGSSGAPFQQVATVPAGQVEYLDTGLQPSTTYAYRVRAVAGTRASSFSNEARATTQPAPPGAPVDLVATVVSSSRVDLSWRDTSDEETGFEVERAPNRGDWVQIGTTGANSTRFVDTTVTAGIIYSYRVRSIGPTGASEYSSHAQAHAIDRPAAPQGLQASAVDTSRINLTWADASDSEDGFWVERRATGSQGSDWQQIAGLAAGTTSFEDSGLQPSVTYAYRVRAFNAAGPSEYSSEASALTHPALSVLQIEPTRVRPGKTAQGTVVLTGLAPAGGVVVSVQSSDRRTARAPQQVTVPEGSLSASFTIKTGAKIRGTRVATWTASAGGVTRTARLVVSTRRKR